MPLIELSKPLTILACFVLWGVIQYSIAWYCVHLPDQRLLSCARLLRTYHWEDGGKVYDRLFRISRWKHLLPDGNIKSKKEKFSKKRLSDLSSTTLSRFVMESIRAELIHWLAIPPFVIFGLFLPPIGVLYMLVYAVTVNLPCIIAQRYNRPRVRRLLEHIAQHQADPTTNANPAG